MRKLLPLLLVACTQQPLPPSTPPVVSTPPPIPPERVVPVARVSGTVTSADGFRVPFANVLLMPAKADCVAGDAELGATTNDNGEYAAMVEGNAGPAYQGCVRVDARSGGARGEVAVPATFALEADAPPVVINVKLARPEPLDEAEAARIAVLLADVIKNPESSLFNELASYVAQGPEALRVAIDQYRQVLGGVTRISLEKPSYEPSPSYRHFTFGLHGTSGRKLHVDVHQEALTRVHSSLIDYGYRSERFMNAYLRSIASGDAEQLARVLNPDDVDFPVSRAREMIIDYRKRYRDTATIRAEFAGVDDSKAAIMWRLRGIGPNGEEVTEPILLRHGDGLIGMVLPGK